MTPAAVSPVPKERFATANSSLSSTFPRFARAVEIPIIPEANNAPTYSRFRPHGGLRSEAHQNKEPMRGIINSLCCAAMHRKASPVRAYVKRRLKTKFTSIKRWIHLQERKTAANKMNLLQKMISVMFLGIGLDTSDERLIIESFDSLELS